MQSIFHCFPMTELKYSLSSPYYHPLSFIGGFSNYGSWGTLGSFQWYAGESKKKKSLQLPQAATGGASSHVAAICRR